MSKPSSKHIMSITLHIMTQVSLINENLDLTHTVAWRYYDEVADEKDETKKRLVMLEV